MIFKIFEIHLKLKYSFSLSVGLFQLEADNLYFSSLHSFWSIQVVNFNPQFGEYKVEKSKWQDVVITVFSQMYAFPPFQGNGCGFQK